MKLINIIDTYFFMFTEQEIVDLKNKLKHGITLNIKSVGKVYHINAKEFCNKLAEYKELSDKNFDFFQNIQKILRLNNKLIKIAKEEKVILDILMKNKKFIKLKKLKKLKSNLNKVSKKPKRLRKFRNN